MGKYQQRLLDPLWKEKNKWNARPFSFEPSAAFAAYLRAKSYNNRKAPSQASMCQSCGSVIVIGGWRLQTAKVHSQPEVYCDLECAREDRSRVYRTKGIAHKSTESKGQIPKHTYTNVTWNKCCECNKRFPSKKASRVCSKECKHAKRIRLWRAKIRKSAKAVQCLSCQSLFTKLSTKGSSTKYCSERCQKKECRLSAFDRRRSRVAGGQYHERIIRTNVFDQAKWKCKQCKCSVKKPDGSNDCNEATLDHVVPIASGGLHVYANVQCLCRRCNTLKRDSIEKATQIRLF